MWSVGWIQQHFGWQQKCAKQAKDRCLERKGKEVEQRKRKMNGKHWKTGKEYTRSGDELRRKEKHQATAPLLHLQRSPLGEISQIQTKKKGKKE